jgi:hypothetical protein
MRSIRVFFSLAALAAAWLAPASLAADTRERNLELDDEQAELAERLNHIEAVASLHGRYVVLRDTYFYGATGLRTGIETWLSDASAWLVKWNELLALAESPQLASLDSPAIRDRVREGLGAQLDAWHALRGRAKALHQRAEEGLRRAGELPELPESFVPGYEAQLHLLNEQVAGLRQALAAASSEIEAGTVTRLDAVIEPSRVAVLAKLRMALLNYPDLQQVLSMVEEALQAEVLVDAHQRDVYARYRDFTTHMAASRIFHAEEALAGLKTEAAASSAAIQASGFDARFTGPALATIAGWVGQAEQLIGPRLSTFRHDQILRGYFVDQSRILAAKCRNTERRKALNCDLLRTLVAIPASALSSMSKEQLRDFEHRLESVKDGPLTQRSNP